MPDSTVRPCAHPGCDRRGYSGKRKMCGTHYARFLAGDPMDAPIRALTPRSGTCSAPTCDRKIWARGLCGAHYVRDFTGVSMDKPIRPRRRRGEPIPPCAWADCEKTTRGGGFGLCPTHWATTTGKSAEYSARRRARKFDGPHERITAADYRRMRTETKVCYLCNDDLSDPVEFDHVIPLALGGRHILANLRPVHKRCNRVKAAHMPPDLLPPQVGQLGLWEEVS